MIENAILVTGFEPFGSETINPSWEAVSRLGSQIGPFSVFKKQLPCAFGPAEAALKEALDRLSPAITICVGQAGGAQGIRLERAALNLRDARIADNAGYMPRDEAVVPGGPNAYFATLPLRQMEEALQKARYPVSLSLSAGSYVCNSVMYWLLHCLKNKNGIGGFIHVPFLPEQAQSHPGAASMPLDDITAALQLCLETAVYASPASPCSR